MSALAPPWVLPVDVARELARPLRRARLVWFGCAGGIVCVALALVVATLARPATGNVLPQGSDAVAVVDVSGSAGAYDPRIARALAALERRTRHLGLVLFSDTAYEALPPTAPSAGIAGWIGAFLQRDQSRIPWQAAGFAGGTAIARGLETAVAALRRDGVRHPHIVLLSDLSDSGTDSERLNAELATLAREHIDLRIVLLGAGTGSAFVDADRADVVATASAKVVDVRALPQLVAPDTTLRRVALLAGLLAVALALYELRFHPFAWAAPQ